MQTVFFPRLGFFGVSPDLILVSVIALAVLAERTPATLFAAAAAFIQDLLLAGFFLNTIIKPVIGNIVSSVKEEFMGDDYSLTAGMVALFTPLFILFEAAFFYFFFQKQSDALALVFRLAAETGYNLILVPPIFYVLKGVIPRGD